MSDLDLNATLAVYEGAADADSPDAYEIQDKLTGELSRRRAVVYAPQSLLDLVRRYGNERYSEAVNGECGSYLDMLTSEVGAEELFDQITVEVERLRLAEQVAEAAYAAIGRQLADARVAIVQLRAEADQLRAQRDKVVARCAPPAPEGKVRLLDCTEIDDGAPGQVQP